ncbi:MAG: FecR domain-containing protein [Nibricoccus sp.]
MREPSKNSRSECEAEAARWLARRDHGLSPAEQDEYLQWLSEHPSHGLAIARLENYWNQLDKLNKWRPAHSATPNPDLLAPVHKRRSVMYQFAAIAAVLVLGIFCWLHIKPHTTQHQAIIHPGPERLVLEDGSVVELNVGAKVDVQFTAQERRVQLVRGEAHFAVAKNPERPFIVSANKFAVRAVGTAFSVALDREAVSVLVTEGKVRLDESSPQAGQPSKHEETRELSHLIAGQKAVMNFLPTPSSDSHDSASPVEITEITPAEIERALAWQGLRLEFVNMPLSDVVAEFNRYNVRKLVVTDSETSAILIGGNFRADNINAFVRLLDAGFGVNAQTTGNTIFLKRSH